MSTQDTAYDLAALTRSFDLAALDMAGTTVDEDGIVYRILEAIVEEEAGEPVPHDLLLDWKGTSKWEAIQGLFAGMGEDASRENVDRVFAVFNERLITAYRETPPKPFPGVVEMFAELRARGVKVVQQTGYDATIAGAIFAGLGWTVGPGPEHTVDALITSDLVAASRPAPYLVFHAMEATGVTDVARVLTSGDTPNDLLAGHHAGAGFVTAVRTGGYDEDRLRTYPHTHILDSVVDITTLL